MKKAVTIFALIVAILLALAALLWANRTSIAAYSISKQLHVPVSIATLEIARGNAHLTKLWIGTPRGSRTKTSFTSQTIDIDSTLKQVLGDPLIVDRVELSNILVGIEMYSSNESNWSRMAKKDDKISPKERDYLIRRLILNNLTVQVMQPNGSIKTYPTISRMEFQNISNETGFPVSEIEKAIFNLVMQDLFRKLNLDQLLDTINAPPALSAPLKMLPKFFN